MHGRVKVRTSAEEAARKKKEQELKVKAYRSLMSQIFLKRNKNQYDEEMLILSGQVLSRNADVYTLWNIRKKCLILLGAADSDEESQNLFNRDLGFAEQCLMVNHKSYGAWHHRCWVLENCPSPDWNKEVALCTKYLKLDERNFHCWDYRKYVVEKAKIPPEQELEFCTEKIRNNFSNYSSWHYRSKLLPLLYPHEKDTNRPISEEKLKEELELVLTAAFTDPNDSSAWFYQRWLLGYSQPALGLAAFRIAKDLAVISFTIPVNIQDYKIQVTSIFNKEFRWKSADLLNKISNVWFSEIDSLEIIDRPAAQVICTNHEGINYTLDLKMVGESFVGVNCPNFEYEFSAAVLEELENQLESCNQLLEFEPESKWTLLTAALLMRAVDRQKYDNVSLEYLKKLENVDPLRKGYYEDLATKWKLQAKVQEIAKNIQLFVDLSSQKLTSIFYEQYFCIAENINLSKNNLKSRSLPKISAFIFSTALDLSENQIERIDLMPNFHRIKELNLQGNLIPECDIQDVQKLFLNIKI